MRRLVGMRDPCFHCGPPSPFWPLRSMQSSLDIEVNAPENMLLMHKYAETAFDLGQFTIIPERHDLKVTYLTKHAAQAVF